MNNIWGKWRESHFSARSLEGQVSHLVRARPRGNQQAVLSGFSDCCSSAERCVAKAASQMPPDTRIGVVSRAPQSKSEQISNRIQA